MASERLQRQIERLLDEADQAIASEDWPTVLSRARSVLAIDPENVDGSAYRSTAERALGRSDGSEGARAQEIAEDSAPAPQGETQLLATDHSPDAERRQLTVMFCDLQTALSQRLDPEELRDVNRSYQEACAKAVSEFDGYIAKYLGDGLLIYFGYPLAHEDDPQRAAHAGLAILDGIQQLNIRLKETHNLTLAVRVGIHTGLVVAGEMGSGENLETLAIVGETPNIAARLQEAADSNTVIVSSVTQRLIQGVFDCQSKGARILRGIAEPMELFQVLRELDNQERLGVSTSAELTELVGREQELGLMLDRWEHAKEGRGQLVLINGEPGIGKSRLVQELRNRLAGEPHVRQGYSCSPYHRDSVLHSQVEFMKRWLRFSGEDTNEEKLEKLEAGLSEYAIQLPEAVPLLASHLSISLDNRYSPPDLTPQQLRQKTLELLTELCIGSADVLPELVIVEDLHWADSTSLELFGMVLERIATAQILAVLTFRPEFVPPWSAQSHFTQISLNRLTRRQTEEMVESVTGGKPVSPEVIEQLTSKSDGLPLFVEELTRMVVESNLVKEVDGRYEQSGSSLALTIPATLQDSLTARLDRISAVR